MNKYITNLEIPGFKIKKYYFSEMPKFGYIVYKTWFCEFAIATDSMGTQICENGMFFGPMNFVNINEAFVWITNDPKRIEELRKVFRKEWFKKLKYNFTWSHIRHLYWQVIHFFNPNFYLR